MEATYVQATADTPLRLLSYQVGNVQGIGARARQEDSFGFTNAFDVRLIKNEGLLFVVCDGMGGMKDGKIASETAVSSIRESFSYMNRNGNIVSQLKESVYLAASKVEAILEGMGGSTVVACIIYKEKLYYASVGDSFLYLKRGDQLYRINKEHTVCSQIHLSMIRRGKVDPTEGRGDPEAVALTQFLGRIGLDEVDCFVRPMHLKEGDVLFACSDGIGGVLSEGEINYALSQTVPEEMCAMIEQGIIAHNKNNQDNYTGIVIKCVK